jgi:hypothetical protein
MAKENVMEMQTKVFIRIVEEREGRICKAATKAIADTMEETYRFGCFARDYIECCAKDRLDQEIAKQK